MASATSLTAANQTTPPELYLHHHWYAVHTSARHEKRVAKQLAATGVDYFLPLYSAVHRWKDRSARVDLPLFPGYLFVNIALESRLQVLALPGVARLVGFKGHPTPLAETEIQALRRGLDAQMEAVLHPYLRVGRKVRVVRGPLMGTDGILVRKKENLRLVLSLHLIMRSVAVEVGADDIEAIC